MRHAMLSALAVVLAVVAAPAFAEEPTRVDLFSREGQRLGYLTVDPARGRFEIYDSKSRRQGYGTVDPNGRVDTFDAKTSQRTDPRAAVPGLGNGKGRGR